MRHILTACILALVLPHPPLSAQNQPDLRQLAGNAGMIFSGVVEKVERVAPVAGDVGTVRVTFRVAEALRGASPGEVLTISEWDGLWNAGDRYRVGERLLLFLYSPSNSLGLTTTVAGEQGRIRAADSPLTIAAVARQIGEDPPGQKRRRKLPRKILDMFPDLEEE
ncbi:MAG: hypothetical protein ACXVZM_12780 [Terriglobales bacterium]